MTETALPVNKDIIDGSKVVHREQAKLYCPNSKYPDGLSPTYGVDKCVLEDNRVVFQCVSPEPPDNCAYWAEKGESVRSHLRTHSQLKKLAEQKALQAAFDALAAKEEQRKENYRNGALKAAANRRVNAQNRNTSANDSTDKLINEIANDNGNEASSMTGKEYQKKLDRAQLAMEGAADGLHKMQTILANIEKTLNNTIVDLEDLSASQPTADPVLVEKAASFDALQALLKGTGSKG